MKLHLVGVQDERIRLKTEVCEVADFPVDLIEVLQKENKFIWDVDSHVSNYDGARGRSEVGPGPYYTLRTVVERCSPLEGKNIYYIDWRVWQAALPLLWTEWDLTEIFESIEQALKEESGIWVIIIEMEE